MSLTAKGVLKKAFMAVAMASAVAGAITPQPANAAPMSMMHMVVVTTTINAANAANTQRMMENIHTQNAVITNPSAQNIKRLIERDLVRPAEVPYIKDVVASMKVPAGTKADAITAAQREQFTQGLKQRQLIGEMSVTTAKEAVAKGLPENLAPYFADCRMPVQTQTISFSQAQGMQDCMSHMHWEHIKPAVYKAVGIGFAFTLAGLGAFMLNEKKKKADNPYRM